MNLFNTIGETYTDTRQADERIVALLVEYLGLSHGATIADIGAGTGNYSNALAEAGLSVPEEMMFGPMGIGFCGNNIPGVAKAVADFAKANELLAIKGGLMGSKVISEDDVQNLAKLPSLDVLRAQMLGLINAPASQLVGVVAGGVRQVVNVLNAYSEQGGEAAAEA